MDTGRSEFDGIISLYGITKYSEQVLQKQYHNLWSSKLGSLNLDKYSRLRENSLFELPGTDNMENLR